MEDSFSFLRYGSVGSVSFLSEPYILIMRVKSINFVDSVELESMKTQQNRRVVCSY